MSFPATLDDLTPVVDGVSEVMAADVNDLQTAIEAIEAKIGIDESEDTDSLDYKVAQLMSNSLLSAGVGTTLPDPAANSGKFYYLTTTDTLYRSNGTAWIAIN